jgi:uncharacterized protein YcbK (DUF882 family)
VRRFTKNFSVDELACKDGTPVPDKFYGNAQAICERAQKLRDLLGISIQVQSGYRTESHNKKVGGAENSAHLTASALDLSCHGWTAEQLTALYEGLIRLGVVPDGGLGTYPRSNGGWIHLDTRAPRRWRG